VKRIKKFQQFNNLDFLSESRVYFMNDLVTKLQELVFDGNEWAGKLINAQGKDIDSDTTFLTLDGENFTFSKQSDIEKVLWISDYKRIFLDEIDEEMPQRISHFVSSHNQNAIANLSNRGRVKIGRVIKKILPEIPDRELEVLVNALKSETSGYEIKLVKGDDISKYYKKENCDEKLLSYGTLNSSCMMDKESENPNIFDIYTKNPETCQLAIMLNSSGKLVARALVWKIDEIYRRSVNSKNGVYVGQDEEDFYSQFNLKWNTIDEKGLDMINQNNYLKAKADNLLIMDRVYYTKDWMENALYKWANQNNFLIRVRDRVSYKGKYWWPNLFVKVNKLAYRQFPYLDTFKYYDVQGGRLSNINFKSRGFELSSTSGKYYARGSKSQKKIDKATNYIRRFKDYLK
jgi:hypothetical protein